MSSHRTTFNHVGLCVSDRERSRRFYESVLGFQFWWELDPPDGPTAKSILPCLEPCAILLEFARKMARVGQEEKTQPPDPAEVARHVPQPGSEPQAMACRTP